jgi:hypothetical protein
MDLGLTFILEGVRFMATGPVIALGGACRQGKAGDTLIEGPKRVRGAEELRAPLGLRVSSG